MQLSCVLGWVKSLSSSLLSTAFFPAALPLTSISLLAAPLSPEAPWEEDSRTTLCPAWGVAWTVLHIISLEITKSHTHIILYWCMNIIEKMQEISFIVFICRSAFWFWPAAIAEHKEEHTEDNASHTNVDSNYDAGSGGFALFIFYTVAWAVEHWGNTRFIFSEQTARFTWKQWGDFIISERRTWKGSCATRWKFI